MFLVSDFVSTFLPILTFWVSAGYCMFQGMTTLSEEDQKRNMDLTPGKMAKRMAIINLIHIVSTFGGIYIQRNLLGLEDDSGFSFRWWTLPVGVFSMDTIQYFFHRLFHTYPFLYKYHKTHHKIRSLHSLGALYNSFEEVVITGLGMGILFYSVLCFTPFEFSVLSSISFVATVQEHTPSYGKTRHWVHHNTNINSNFQQPFFCYWDKLLGTYHDPNKDE